MAVTAHLVMVFRRDLELNDDFLFRFSLAHFGLDCFGGMRSPNELRQEYSFPQARYLTVMPQSCPVSPRDYVRPVS